MCACALYVCVCVVRKAPAGSLALRVRADDDHMYAPERHLPTQRRRPKPQCQQCGISPPGSARARQHTRVRLTARTRPVALGSLAHLAAYRAPLASHESAHPCVNPGAGVPVGGAPPG